MQNFLLADPSSKERPLKYLKWINRFTNLKYKHFNNRIMMFNLRKGLGLARLTHLTPCQFGIFKFNLPDLGQKIKQGTIKRLYISEGQDVTEFQKLADVASDKQFTEITASTNGKIKKIHYKEQDICQVGDLFLEIETKDENSQTQTNTPKQQTKQSSTKNQTAKSAKESHSSGQELATPFVRNMIKQNKLDISKIKGSGQNGRILQIDVQKLIAHKNAPQTSSSKPSAPQTSFKTSSSVPERETTTNKGSQTIKMSNFEKGMQKSMTQSNTIPHLYLHQQFDITETEKMRKAIKSSNQKVTVMGILIKTFSLALKKYPRMNSIYEPNKNQFEFTMNSEHNISIAIDSPNGLVVPNIKSVNNLNLKEIQSELERLKSLSEQAKLTSKQLANGTVCLSNIGTIGGTHACPLILPPQVCIVAIGKMQVLPKYKGDQLVPRSVINVSFGCDHRVVDGATVARFSNQWKKVIQNPYLALAEMA